MYLSSLTLHPDKFPNIKDHPFPLPVFRNNQSINRIHRKHHFCTGENGSGISTRIKP
jgi:predicted ATPase